MMRSLLMVGLLLTCGALAGCRSCFLLNPYANTIDDINDTHVYFDDWYMPRLDISRAGRPDWCGPINRRLGKNICYFGCYDRYDDCNLYPPQNPYSYPGSSLPEPKVWTPPATPTPTPAPSELPAPAPGTDPVE
jgi:hypothetical protein